MYLVNIHLTDSSDFDMTETSLILAVTKFGRFKNDMRMIILFTMDIEFIKWLQYIDKNKHMDHAHLSTRDPGEPCSDDERDVDDNAG